jgi:hypothetical protein
MSYKNTVIVARFTEADEEEFKRANPGVDTRRMQPVINTRAEAREEAIKIASREIANNEVVAGIRLTEETDAGWIFSATVIDKYLPELNY